MSRRQLLEWEAIYAIEPWGEWREDVRADHIAHAALAPHAKRGQRLPSLADYFAIGRTRQAQSDESMKATLHAWLKKGKPKV